MCTLASLTLASDKPRISRNLFRAVLRFRYSVKSKMTRSVEVGIVRDCGNALLVAIITTITTLTRYIYCYLV